jgi:hypothetical protein
MAVRLKALKPENAKLKRIVAEQMLDMSAMKELLQKRWLADGEEQSRGLPDDGARLERAAQLPDRRTGAIGATVPPGAEG